MAQSHDVMSENDRYLFERVMDKMETRLDQLLSENSNVDEFTVSLRILAMEYDEDLADTVK